ncbi:MAG: 4-phosphoerythronate dehydrogenase [Acidobacteria bacterium]|nr:4-phosphoerythronate dehydrogenase [Acidobacteriota bacterium]
MIIAVDRALPYWKETFSDLGEVCPFTGNELRPETLRGVGALVVRTVTPVNADLLEGSDVRFVGAASAGMDHVDQEYLRRKKIHFCCAAGCNADAVSEYIITALHAVAVRRNWTLAEKSLAVIGVGHVGSRVARKARAFGMNVLLCDPPLRDATGNGKYQPFESVLAADILTFHTPLTEYGPYPTRHMLNRGVIDRLNPGQFLVNTSRGEVFDGRALAGALREKKILGAVLDVWEGEPEIDYSLLELADIGTPHIAGTTFDGKIRAVTLIRGQLCEFLGIASTLNTDGFYPPVRRIRPQTDGAREEIISQALRESYDIAKDDAALRKLASLPENLRGKNYEQLRATRFLRQEFPHYTVELDESGGELSDIFTGIGFNTHILRRK